MEVIYCVEIELQIKKLDGIFFLLSSNGCVSVDVKASYISSYYIHPYMTDFYQAKIYALTISSLCSYLLKICIFRKRYVSVAGGGSEITLHGSLDYTQAEHSICKVTDTIFFCIIYFLLQNNARVLFPFYFRKQCRRQGHELNHQPLKRPLMGQERDF